MPPRTMRCYSSRQYQEEYEMKVDREFEFEGQVAQWSANDDGPRFWGDEDESITWKIDPGRGNAPSRAAAVSPDHCFIAIAHNTIIRVYNLESLEIAAELVGHESNVQQLVFLDRPRASVDDSDTRYILFAADADVSGSCGNIFTWSISKEGRLSKQMSRMPLAVHHFATRAVENIIGDLRAHHNFDAAEIDLIRNGFGDVLRTADTQNRAKEIPKFEGRFPSFQSNYVSHDETRILNIAHGRTTQHGMRPPDELPQIVVRDVASAEEKCRLKGHEDGIMWAGWSIDDNIIATASWDSTYKIWNANTGECKHTLGHTDGQNWAGAFLPDGKHLILSGGRPIQFGVYNIATGEQVGFLATDESNKLDHWLRYFAVNPANGLLVLQNGITLLAFDPVRDLASRESGQLSKIQEIFSFHRDEDDMKNRFQRIFGLKWDDDDNKLLARSSEDTLFVWDMKKNLKWRFQRPKGIILEASGPDFFVKRKGGKWIVSVDGDGVIRLWKLE